MVVPPTQPHPALRALAGPARLGPMAWTAAGLVAARQVGEGCEVLLWGELEAPPASIWRLPSRVVESLDPSPTGEAAAMLLTSSAGERAPELLLLDLPSGEGRHVPSPHGPPSGPLCWAPDGGRLALAVGTAAATLEVGALRLAPIPGARPGARPEGWDRQGLVLVDRSSEGGRAWRWIPGGSPPTPLRDTPPHGPGVLSPLGTWVRRTESCLCLVHPDGHESFVAVDNPWLLDRVPPRQATWAGPRSLVLASEMPVLLDVLTGWALLLLEAKAAVRAASPDGQEVVIEQDGRLFLCEPRRDGGPSWRPPGSFPFQGPEGLTDDEDGDPLAVARSALLAVVAAEDEDFRVGDYEMVPRHDDATIRRAEMALGEARAGLRSFGPEILLLLVDDEDRRVAKAAAEEIMRRTPDAATLLACALSPSPAARQALRATLFNFKNRAPFDVFSRALDGEQELEVRLRLWDAVLWTQPLELGVERYLAQFGEEPPEVRAQVCLRITSWIPSGWDFHRSVQRFADDPRLLDVLEDGTGTPDAVARCVCYDKLAHFDRPRALAVARRRVTDPDQGIAESARAFLSRAT